MSKTIYVVCPIRDILYLSWEEIKTLAKALTVVNIHISCLHLIHKLNADWDAVMLQKSSTLTFYNTFTEYIVDQV